MSQTRNPQITTNGKKLAAHIGREIGVSKFTEETCSLICRHAATHHGLAERECNGPGEWVDRLPVEQAQDVYQRHAEETERKQKWIEKRIADLVSTLPPTPDGQLVPLFQGDPRGATVKLLVEGHDRHYLYNGFALEAIIVPTER